MWETVQTLVCEEADCDATLVLGVGGRHELRSTQQALADIATRAGWQTRAGRHGDRCPDHATLPQDGRMVVKARELAVLARDAAVAAENALVCCRGEVRKTPVGAMLLKAVDELNIAIRELYPFAERVRSGSSTPDDT